MKKFLLLALCFLCLLMACPSTVEPVDPVIDVAQYENDERLFMDGAKGRWIVYPNGVVNSKEMCTDPEILALCNKPGHLYILYFDGSIIEFNFIEYPWILDPARMEVEANNSIYHPDKPMGIIVIPPPPEPEPVTLYDPVLPPLTIAFCFDDGSIDFIHTFEDTLSDRTWYRDLQPAPNQGVNYRLVLQELELRNINRVWPNKVHFVYGPRLTDEEVQGNGQ